MNRGVAWAEMQVTILYAGPAAGRRAPRGSGPGWRRLRSDIELRSFHEAGYAVAAAVLGQFVLRVDVVERLDLLRRGICVHAHEPGGEIGRDIFECRHATDENQAVRLCSLLSRESGWRSTLLIARGLRRRAEVLLDQHWFHVQALAEALARRGLLNEREIQWYLPQASQPVESEVPA